MEVIMVKIISGIIIGILILIFMIQNTAAVEMTFFFWTINISRAILLLIFLVSGIFLGVVLTEIAYIRKNMKMRKKDKEKQGKKEQKKARKHGKNDKADEEEQLEET
jgi:lipopolysaccharide assembly protein A